jgi:hypothetical protein
VLLFSALIGNNCQPESAQRLRFHVGCAASGLWDLVSPIAQPFYGPCGSRGVYSERFRFIALRETFGLIAGREPHETRVADLTDRRCECSTVFVRTRTSSLESSGAVESPRAICSKRSQGSFHTAASDHAGENSHTRGYGGRYSCGRGPRLARLDCAEHDAITAPLEGERNLGETPAWLAAVQTRENGLRRRRRIPFKDARRSYGFKSSSS